MEAFECKGSWWLPGEESRRVAGVLKVSSRGGMTLSLFGVLGAAQSLLIGKSHPIILGSVSKSPKGNDVTLTGSFLVGSTLGSFVDSREQYHIARGYFGALLPELSDFAFGAMRLRIGALEEWLHPLSGFKHTVVPAKVGEPVSLGSYILQPPVRAEVPGASIAMEFELSGTLTRGDCSYHEEAEITIKCPTALTAEEFEQKFVSVFLSLMTFVTDKPQPIKRYGLYQRDEPDREILVVGELVQPNEPIGKRQPRWYELLFTLKDVQFADFIVKWLDLTVRHSAACDVYFGVMNDPPGYVDITFQSVANAVQLYFASCAEGAAQRQANAVRMQEIRETLPQRDQEWLVDHLGVNPRVPFQTVLGTLMEKHGDSIDPLIGGMRDRFVDRVLGTLEYIIWRDPDSQLAAASGAELYWLTEKLRFLLKACFLHEIGFSAQDIQLHFGRNDLYQHVYREGFARESGTVQVADSVELTGSPEFTVFWEHLRKESPRARAIAIGTYFDDRLGQLLGVPEESFRAKIETAHRKALLTANERDDLDAIRRLRNIVNHLGSSEFTSAERRLVEGLKTWTTAVAAWPQYELLIPTVEDRLLYVATVLATRLKSREVGNAPLVEPDITDTRYWPPLSTN